ncbi:hybrid sensor histidine kinase/response regulator [Teredinibacter waterburyi]|uniref:hybrid sensor histidine kinase/response regulator n=1 Tax=Teredinibacter waterburyi TaxID=1500538 RepID=UPI00165F7300|nr:hybrid sensor histidine kinase/response regulator [Teredinibacter waterburyi]
MRVFLGGAAGEVIEKLKSLCSEYDCHHDYANDLVGARKLLDAGVFDLVCLAQYFDDGSAFELCREIRGQLKWQECPVLLITERSQPALIEKAFASGFNETFSLQQLPNFQAFIHNFSRARHPIEGRVLLVEDSPSQQRMVEAVLSRIGLQVKICADAHSALALFETEDFDLIITDVVLEGELTGLDLIGRIRTQSRAQASTPILVMSSYQSQAQRVEPFRIGASDYVSKPLAIDELLARARRLIESHKLLQQVHEQQLSLEHANDVMTHMLSRVSHECRNSVNIVLGVTQLLRRKETFSDAQNKKLDTITSATRHQLSLLNDILDFTQLESGEIELNLEVAEIRELVDDVVSLFVYSCEEKNLALMTEYADNLPKHCELDVRLVKQTLINLLSNAVKFTLKGQIKLRVWVEQNTLRFEVSDSGPGIARDEVSLLFSAFKQTSTGRLSGTGSGLGLSLCSAFATVMGGELAATSVLGGGSQFRLTLPLTTR